MKVILVADVKNVGKNGDIVEVSDGYGTNFLIKRGLAKLHNQSNLNDWKKQKENNRFDENKNTKKKCKFHFS